MELCLRTPDGAAAVVEFGHDAGVSDVAAAFSKLVSYPVHVGSIAAFQGCDGSERLSETGVAGGDEVCVSHPTAHERLARFPSDLHHDVALRLYSGGALSDLDARTLEHARCLAEAGHPATARFRGYSRKLTELGGPIWSLGHETWLSDVVRDYLLAQPEDFAPFEGGGSMLDARRGEVYHLPRAIMEDSFFRRCQCDSFGDVRAGLLAETAERWGDEHPLCKVASLLPDKLAVIAKSTAAFADAVWTCREAVMPDARYVHAKGASVDTLPDAIPEAFCVMEDPVPWRRTLYLDVRAISVAAKHGVSLEQMWQSLSAHMLRRADDKEYASVGKFFRARYKLRDTRRWLAACWRLLALGLHPETRGARGVRGLQLCVRLRSRVGCLLFLAAGADRANVQTVGPCFDAGKECAGDCACHAHHSGVVRLRSLEGGKYPEPNLNDVDADVECYCFTCQGSLRGCDCSECCARIRAAIHDDILPEDPGPCDRKDSRMERSGRMHAWHVRSNRSRATRR